MAATRSKVHGSRVTKKTVAPKKSGQNESKSSSVLKVGSVIPSIPLMCETGKLIDLVKEAKKGPIVLWAYPRASTPGKHRPISPIKDL